MRGVGIRNRAPNKVLSFVGFEDNEIVMSVPLGVIIEIMTPRSLCEVVKSLLWLLMV